MMLIQQMSSPPMPPPPASSPPASASLPINARINNEAANSILQLNKSAWTSLQAQAQAQAHSTTYAPLTPTISASSDTTATTTTNDHSLYGSSQSSLPSTTGTTSAKTPTADNKGGRAFTIHPASPTHAPQIRHIGATVFANTFGFSIPPADLANYLATSYSLESIQAELNDTSVHRFLIAVAPPLTAEEIGEVEVEAERIIGFAQITRHTTEPCLSHIPQRELVELQRLYVLPEYQNLGVGRGLLEAAEGVALNFVQDKTNDEDEDEDEDALEDDECFKSDRRRKRRANNKEGRRKVNMWLGVWEGNFVAQNVYEKLGYERVGEHEFRMGRCVQIDWVMVKEL